MKLAEALQERADLKIKLSNLSSRITNNCLCQEGERPAEDPNALIKEYDECIGRFNYLVEKINLTNCRTDVDGKTLTSLLAEKDALSLRVSMYRNLVNTASSGAQRARRTEIKILSTVNVAKLQKTADELARELRLLDNKIQAANWTSDLIE